MSETLPDEIEKELASYGIAVGRSARAARPDAALIEMEHAARTALVAAVIAYGREERARAVKECARIASPHDLKCADWSCSMCRIARQILALLSAPPSPGGASSPSHKETRHE